MRGAFFPEVMECQWLVFLYIFLLFFIQLFVFTTGCDYRAQEIFSPQVFYHYHSYFLHLHLHCICICIIIIIKIIIIIGIFFYIYM